MHCGRRAELAAAPASGQGDGGGPAPSGDGGSLPPMTALPLATSSEPERVTPLGGRQQAMGSAACFRRADAAQEMEEEWRVDEIGRAKRRGELQVPPLAHAAPDGMHYIFGERAHRQISRNFSG